MPKFTVSYETTKKPVGLPLDAKITRLSALPLTIKPSTYGGDGDVELDKGRIAGSVAFLTVGMDSVWLTKDEVKDLIEGLQELV